MCTKSFLNYFSAIIEFLKVVFKGETIKFQRIVALLQLRKVERWKYKLWNFKRIIIIINYQNCSRKPRKFSRS